MCLVGMCTYQPDFTVFFTWTKPFIVCILTCRAQKMRLQTLGIDQNGRAVCETLGQCAQTWWSWKCILLSKAIKPLAKREASLDNCRTCFKRPVVLRFEGVRITLHCYSSILSPAAILAIGGVACITDMGLKFTSLYMHTHTQ